MLRWYSERPAEAADRAVPGHWEGDLVVGRNSRSAIATLVERSTRYLMLVHLPTCPQCGGRPQRSHRHGHDPPAPPQTVPHLGPRLRDGHPTRLQHRHRRPGLLLRPRQPLAARLERKHQRPAAAVRQYFRKDSGLSVHTREDLDAVAAELNSRPRKTLGWEPPAERPSELLAA